MENDGIQKLLKAEEEASQVVAKAREARAARLRQAAIEAEKSSNELKKQLEAEFKADLAKQGAGESNFIKQLKDTAAKESAAIDAGYEKNKTAVIDLLLHHVTTVNLDVSEALRQSLLTKADQGTS